MAISALISPVIQDQKLRRDELEPGLVVFRCPTSDGVWIPPVHYWTWRDRSTPPERSQPLEIQPDDSEADRAETHGVDSPAGKRCPEDGAFLIRYRVAHDVTFHIDRCGRCGGIWLDHREWEQLKAHGLHDQMHLIFTASWQAAIRSRDRMVAAEKRLQQQLGEKDWSRTQATRRWLEGHPHASIILAHLSGDD